MSISRSGGEPKTNGKLAFLNLCQWLKRVAIKAFEEGLRSLGYRVGENVVIEYRFADGELERLPALAADLVRLGVDVIVTGFNPNTVAAMKATTTIPIVMTNSSLKFSNPAGRAGVRKLLARNRFRTS